MRRFLLLTAILISLILISCGGGQKTPSDIKDRVAWLDARSALPVFPFGTNPIYIYFYSENSPVCSSMTANIFNRPEIIKYLNEHFTCISVLPDNFDSIQFLNRMVTYKELIKALKVEGYPAHYFFNKSGQLKGARTGYIKLTEFKQLLKYISGGYVEKMDFATFMSKEDSEVDTTWGEF